MRGHWQRALVKIRKEATAPNYIKLIPVFNIEENKNIEETI